MNVEQKIIYVREEYLSSANNYLKEGWIVKSIHPISTRTEHTYHFGAYMLLERVNVDNYIA